MEADGGVIHINSEASAKIYEDALKPYFQEQGINSVEIKVELYYGWDASLLFVFSPSGAYFNPNLELTIAGGYIAENMTLLGEDGEALECTVKKKGNALTFYIPHFSKYSYDHYY